MSTDVDLTGLTLGARYLVTGALGRGGMATVYECTDLETGTAVAVKVLRPELTHLVGEGRFTREIRIAQQIAHPNIVPLLDSGTADGHSYFVMPLLRGGTLRARIQEQAQLTAEETLRIALAIASALAHAHKAGVVHRDIKPENVLLDDTGVYVADFGIARLFDDPEVGQKLTTTGLVLGTPAYMSPEQSAADPRLDPRSDVYSVGCVMYEMLAGAPPFTGATPQAIAARHFVEAPPPLRVVRPNVPAYVASAIERCLAKAPAERFQSMDALIAALNGDATSLADASARTGAQAEPDAIEQARIRRNKRRTRWATAAVLVVATLIGTYWRSAAAGVGADPRYALFPLAVQSSTPGASPPGLLANENANLLLYDALRPLLDSTLVDQLRLTSQMRVSGVPTRLDSIIDMTRALGAQKAIGGAIVLRGDSVFVRASVYDARRRSMPEPEVTAVAAFSTADATASGSGAGTFNRAFQVLARQLLARKPDGDAQELLGTDSRAALLAKLSADSARYHWNLPLALERYQRARALDRAYPQASLGVAQVSEWLNEDAATWRDAASDAVRLKAGLVDADAIAAEALQHLAEQRYPEACSAYARLLARDSTSFDALFGLGECRLQDDVVVRDERSPTKFRFRSSFAAAQRYYDRALRATPLTLRDDRAVAINRLISVMPTKRAFRPGNFNGRAFAAEPFIDGDTITYYPLDQATAMNSKPDSVTVRKIEALYEANARGLAEYAALWVAEFSASSAAWYALAINQERSGNFDGAPSRSALYSIRKARVLARTRTDSIRRAVDELRIQMRRLDARAAKTLVDSLLAIVPADAEQAHVLTRVAAIANDPGKLRQTLRMWKADEVISGPDFAAAKPPRPVADAVADLLWYSVTGKSVDSLAHFELQLNRAVDGWAPPDVEKIRRHLLFTPALLGFPWFGIRAAHLDSSAAPSLKAQLDFARGSSASREVVLRRVRERIGVLGLTVSGDQACLDVELMSAARDSVGTQLALARLVREVQRLSATILDNFQAPAMLQRCRPLMEVSTASDVKAFETFLTTIIQ